MCSHLNEYWLKVSTTLHHTSWRKARQKHNVPFQAFYKFAGWLEEVAQAFGYWVFPPLRWSFALFCVDRERKQNGFCLFHSNRTTESIYFFWINKKFWRFKVKALVRNCGVTLIGCLIFSLIPMNTSVLTNSRKISSSDRLLPNWQPTWHDQQHGRSGMFFDISCAPVARHHLTVMLAANSRLWALREPLALRSQRDTNCVHMYVCVCLPAYTIAAGAWHVLSYSHMSGAKEM